MQDTPPKPELLEDLPPLFLSVFSTTARWLMVDEELKKTIEVDLAGKIELPEPSDARSTGSGLSPAQENQQCASI